MFNSAASVKVYYEPLRSLAAGSITGAYAAVGTPFVHPVRQLIVHNLTNANVLVSFDGVTDHTVLSATSAEILDHGSNKSNQGGDFVQTAWQKLDG